MLDENSLRARAYYYEFLAFLLFFCNDEVKFNKWQAQLNYLASSPITPDDEEDFKALSGASFEEFLAEQNDVLYDLSYANIPLTASFYEEGRDDGAARLRVIGLLKRAGYRRSFERCKDSEDFTGFILLFASQLLLDGLKDSKDVYLQELFVSVINGYIDEFISLLKAHSKARLFRHYANILQSFIELERAILGVNAPPKKERSVALEAMNKTPHQSKMPTAKSKIFWDEFTAL